MPYTLDLATTIRRVRSRHMAAPRKKTAARRALNGKTDSAPGRPSKDTPENREKVVQAITIGCTHKLACQMVGISESSLSRWRRDDEDFDNAVLAAEGQCERSLVAVIQRAAQGTPARAAVPARAGQPGSAAVAAVLGDWKAAAFILERKWPGSWGRKFNLEHTGKGGAPIQHEHSQVQDFSGLSSDQQIALFELLDAAEKGAVGGPQDGA